jgi:hypothetical protein
MSDSDDFTKLDDPEFLAERRRVRDALDGTQDSAASPSLTARLEAMNEEFLRRARTCWGGGQ